MMLRLPALIPLLWLFVRGLCPGEEPLDSLHDPTGTLTRAQALALADTHNPELRTAQWSVQAAEGIILQAAAVPNPALSLEAENFGGRGAQKRFDAAEYTAQVEQTFELGGKRDKRKRVAHAEAQLAGLDREAVRLDTRAETIRRFVGVLGAQAQVELAREAVSLAEAVARTTATRVETGKVSSMEQEKAEMLLAQKMIDRDQARQVLATARTQLAAQWGRSEPAFAAAVDDLTTVPTLPPLPDLLRRLHGNPDLARWTCEQERARAILVQEQAARLPDLSVAAGVRRANETDACTLVAGVTVPLPLFDQNQGKIREAEARLAMAEQQQRAAEAKAAAGLTSTYQQLVTATNRVAAWKSAVLPRARAVFETTQTGYAQGKFSYLELLDAQRTLVDAQTVYIDALTAVHTGAADLERIVGLQLPAHAQK